VPDSTRAPRRCNRATLRLILPQSIACRIPENVHEEAPFLASRQRDALAQLRREATHGWHNGIFRTTCSARIERVAAVPAQAAASPAVKAA
jgi:hypothetical protein